MEISAWWALGLMLPALVVGEVLVKRSRTLSRLNAPAPVIGGLLFAGLIAAGNGLGWFHLNFATEVNARWWTWLVCADSEWRAAPARNVATPFILIFFACVGLATSWRGLKQSSGQLLAFLGLAVVLAVLQNVIGVGLAKMLDQPPALGVVCGSLALTGGHITALGFANELQRLGLQNALGVSLATATCGIMVSAVVGGLLAGHLIRQRGLRPAEAALHTRPNSSDGKGLWHDLRSLLIYGRPFLTHIRHIAESGVLEDLRFLARRFVQTAALLALILVCVKLGAWLNYWTMQRITLFPVYIGSMLVGMIVRAALDVTGRNWIKADLLDVISSVTLGCFISCAMMSLNLRELGHSAGPILLIFVVQVVVMVLFAWFVTFRLMGRTYDAAVMTSGHVGFALGETPNAVGNMKALAEVFGPSPRAFLVVAVGSSFLVKLFNALNIYLFFSWLKA